MNADVVVVGLGAVGAATLYQLARKGVSAIGIDRWSPPHTFGSSHGETRITRQGIGEGDVYVPLALRSHEIWRELEAATGETLLQTCGVLILGPADGRAQIHGKGDFVTRSAEAAQRFGIPHERLSADEVRARFPQFELRGDETSYFEPGGGFVIPERCIAAQLLEAKRLGAHIINDAEALRIEDTARTARVVTDSSVYEASKVVVAAGAWTPGLVDGMSRLQLQPQMLHWFACDAPSLYRPGNFPVFIWMHGAGLEDSFYGFPITESSSSQGLKVAMETATTIGAPNALDRRPNQMLSNAMFDRHVRGRLRGVGPSLIKSSVCLYTMAPDADFAIGRLENADRVIVASACSGHGFKHSAALGEMIASNIHGSFDEAFPSAFDPKRPILAEVS